MNDIPSYLLSHSDSYKSVVNLHVPNTNVNSRPCAISSGQETVPNKIAQDMSQ